jgi:hypothetical protein
MADILQNVSAKLRFRSCPLTFAIAAYGSAWNSGTIQKVPGECRVQTFQEIRTVPTEFAT